MRFPVPGDHILKFTDLVCKCDGMSLDWTNPLDTGSVDGVLTDGPEAVFDTGPWDWIDLSSTLETCTLRLDNDVDGPSVGNAQINGLSLEFVFHHTDICQSTYTDSSMRGAYSAIRSDGLEICSREVHILKESTKQEVKNWTIHSNPAIADTDSNGINNYCQFENLSDPLKNDTDGDYILDGDELQGMLTQIGASPQEILKFDDGTQIKVEVKYEYDSLTHLIPVKVTLKVSVRLRDTAGLETLYVRVEGQDPKTHYFSNHNKYVDQISIEFKFDWLRSLGGGYDINVTVFDRNNNGNCTKTHIDGLAEGVVKALIKGFWAFVEAVGKFLSAMFEWIWNAIRTMINGIFKPIIDAFNDFRNVLVNSITELFTKGDMKLIPKILLKIFTHPVMMGMLGIAIVLQAIALLTLPFRVVLIPLSSLIANFIQPLILSIIGFTILSITKTIDFDNFGPNNIASYIVSLITNPNSGRASSQSEIGFWGGVILSTNILFTIITGIASWIIGFEKLHYIPLLVIGSLLFALFMTMLSIIYKPCALGIKLVTLGITCILSGMALKELKNYKTGGTYNIDGVALIVANEHAKRDSTLRILMMAMAIGAITTSVIGLFV